MPDQNFSLALSILKSHPDFVASILEQHNSEEVATFLSKIPRSHASPVLQRFMPRYTSRLISSWDVETSVRLLSQLDTSLLAAILRYLDSKHRNRLLKVLPTKISVACKLLLKYSQDMAGAWMTPLVATVPPEYSVKETLEYLKATTELVYTDLVFIVDRDRQIKGLIRVADLLRTDTSVLMTSITETEFETIFSRSKLSHVEDEGNWQVYDAIPVINKNGQFLGVLRHVDLQRGLKRLVEKSGDIPKHQQTEMGIGELYGKTLLSLFQTFGQIIDSNVRR